MVIDNASAKDSSPIKGSSAVAEAVRMTWSGPIARLRSHTHGARHGKVMNRRPRLNVAWIEVASGPWKVKRWSAGEGIMTSTELCLSGADRNIGRKACCPIYRCTYCLGGCNVSRRIHYRVYAFVIDNIGMAFPCFIPKQHVLIHTLCDIQCPRSNPAVGQICPCV